MSYAVAKAVRSTKYLNEEHRFGRDLHVMSELEVSEEGHRLGHAHIAKYLEADIGDGLPRLYQTHDVLCYDV